MLPKQMTTSVAKGSKAESSDAHNDRKTNLEHAPEDKKKKFYEQKGHEHIIQNYTHLNEDLIIKDKRAMYDKLFEDSVKQYNDRQKRADRQIGKGKALTRSEKKLKIELLTKAMEVRKMKKADRQKFLASLNPQDEASEQLKKFLQATSNQPIKELRKELTQAKHATTLGEAYYLKLYHAKQSSTHKEFIMQIGNASDFNEMDPNNPKRILKSYDREDPNGVWQRSKHVLEEYVKNFEKRNPYMKICNASIHMDEKTPHLHMQIIPVADSEKMVKRGTGTKDRKTGKVTKKARHTGLAVKNSFNGALECEGYKRQAKDNRAQFEDWSANEQNELARLMEKELGITRKRGKTNKFKNIHEYKEYQRQAEQELDKAQNYKKIADNNAALANQNYDIYQSNQDKIKNQQDKLDKLKQDTVEAQNELSSVQKEKQRQLDALSQEIAQKRSKRLRELSTELDEKRQKEEMKLKAREDAVSKREVNVKNRETDLDAIQYGGYDSKGIKHKSINQRIKEGIKRGMEKVQETLLHPIKTFTYAYRKSMVEQQHPNYTKEQVKKVATGQEKYLESQAGGAGARILREMSSDRFEKQSVKAIGIGTKALAKELPSYQLVDEAINDAILLDQLENEEKQHKQEKQTPKDKDEESPDFFEDF